MVLLIINGFETKNMQGVSEIRVLILTGRRTHQFMKLFSTTFYNIRKSFPRFFAPQFLPNEAFCVINYKYIIVSNFVRTMRIF
jgi:hypothetical protein